MSANRIMLIRHAEKPEATPLSGGVNLDGGANTEALSVRGWARAGALAVLLAPSSEMIVDARIAIPNALFACPARKPGESERAVQTLQPLAAKLGIEINTRFGRGDEAALAIAATETEGTVLIAWEHKALPMLARAIVGKHVSVPEHWPSDRFDVIWLLEQMEHAQPWYFRQVPQLLLAGDTGVTPEG
ncbi:hypothetical protein [Amantichitinum ursilacus]|uniref:Histidine phosphatase superfamily (Branch 1) n=1 Tax=Amantichitinum ursilacus TaxID=857265 RepID=A0A0N0GKV7_9NEIS|nr:hypothetical protein [Amantichitinum ursilacus]KPC49214.1 hypothetical protein WG78_21880 [Amantichitinum ursilacus]